MSHAIMALSSAGSQASSHHVYIKSDNPLAPKSILKPCSQVSFNTHFSKQAFSLKTHSRSHRFAPTKAATINNSLYVETDQSFYDLLGISENGTVWDIKQAYRQLARKYHPDVSPPDRTEEYTKKFILVQEAYETLCDPHSRALYDRDMSNSLRFAFSARKPFHHNHKEGSNERSEWRRRWQSQLSELQMRSMKNGDLSSRKKASSWGYRMRRRQQEGPNVMSHNVI